MIFFIVFIKTIEYTLQIERVSLKIRIKSASNIDKLNTFHKKQDMCTRERPYPQLPHSADVKVYIDDQLGFSERASKKSLKIPKRKLEVVYRRRNNTMANTKRTKRQTMVYKTPENQTCSNTNPSKNGRHHDLVNRCEVSVSHMTTDMIRSS